MDAVLQTSELDESARTTGRKSARNRPIGIITRGERRRSWTPEQKREIVAESLGCELTPTEVAQARDQSSGQLYTWRQQLLGTAGAVIERAIPRFSEVALAPTPPCASAPAPTHAGGMIEILLPSGMSLRVDAAVDGGALRRVLDALDRR